MATENEARHVLLCDGCATEAGAHEDADVVGPGADLQGAACQRCGAILAGFAYRVHEDRYTGMNPGPG